MPRYSNKQHAFQVGDFWLSQRKGSPAWYRTWFDSSSRQTKRVSLGTDDLSKAKQLLTDWFVAFQSAVETENSEPLLAEILTRYFEGHAKHQVSAERTRIALRYWIDFWVDAELQDVRSLAKQENFHEWLRGRGQSNGSIRRILTSGRAAINRAWKRSEISQNVHIQMVAVANEPPMGRPLDVQDIRRLLAVSPLHLQRFILWGIATGARPDALLDLRWSQIDCASGLIQLNPDGRTQTKKYRPTVRLPKNLLDLVGGVGPEDSAAIEYQDKPVKAIRTAWRKARARAQLDDQVQPYSLRHTVARWLRTSGVPAWQVAAQLGHSISQHSMTERYAPYDPSYLSDAVRAIEGYLEQLRVNCVSDSTADLSLTYCFDWRTHQDSNLRPLPSEGSALSS